MVGRAAIAAIASSGSAVAVGKAATTARSVRAGGPRNFGLRWEPGRNGRAARKATGCRRRGDRRLARVSRLVTAGTPRPRRITSSGT